ncbi:hypothetical protein F5141DRAFT_1189864 [Pisolithus sp. B1]|nr:hypothetical protein F5141DRAFT_1189864 [Pisolithus sp. B1]
MYRLRYDPTANSLFYDTERPPELPSADHFRTSLILPELVRRFTLLRTPTGDPVSLEDLKQRFAAQRARGGPNQISETEEDMFLEKLGRMHSKSTTSNKADRHEPTAGNVSTDAVAESDYTPERLSNYSNNTSSSSSTYPTSSLTSSPSSRSAKRYSNNLFSSGRLRDYSYLRSASQKSGSSRSAASITPTDSSQSLREGASLISSDSLRPVTPEGSGHDSSAPSSPNEKTPVARSVSLVSSIEDMPPRSESEHHDDNSRPLEGSNPASCQRTSAAIAQVFKEIEEEAEDEINHSSTHLQPAADYEAGTAISSDKHIVIDPGTHRMSPIPTGRPGATSPRLPGYVPGMPRPMTPRDPVLDEDIRSHSTTPRAMSPNPSGHVSQLPSTSFTSGPLRRGSDASRSTPRPTSPPSYTSSSPYSSRSPTGRRTPDESQRDSTSGTEQESSGSSLFLRRRPVSPLTNTTFQPMAVSPRPSTPSNVTWNVGTTGKSESRSMHSRNGSLTDTDFSVNADPSKSLTMSPNPSDAPVTSSSTSSKWSRSASPAASTEYRSPSSLSGYDVVITLRSPTPTQSRNVASPAFASSESNPIISRTSKQHASNFSLGSSQLSLSPLANSSRSSLESTGSSYHSDSGQAKRQTPGIFANGAGQPQRTWHDLDKSNSTTPSSSQEECDFEDIVRRYAGLTKSDFFTIQERLVGAMVQKSSYPDTRERANSLRRRRPSTSQSNYSVNGREGRVASPQPTQSVTPGTRSPAPDNNAKASALLESVVDDKVESKPPSELSPTTRRNRDLARALGFGTEEEDNGVPEPISTHEPEPSSSSASLAVEAILPQVPYPDPEDANSRTVTSLQPEDAPFASSPNPNLQRSISLRDPGPVDQNELEKEVQRKAEAATAALMKTTSGQKFTEANSSMLSVTRKRISPSQISTPVLVSAPTSVETIPLPQPTTIPPSNTQSSLGITQRVRRLRNTLRVKPSVSSVEEISSLSTDQQPQNNTPSGLHRRPTLPKFGAASSSDPAKAKVPASNTQTSSTTPGLKGLIARFRKPKASETHGDSHSSNHSRTSPSDSSPTASSHRGNSMVTSSTKSGASSSAEATARPATVTAALNNEMDPTAVKQLFEAASNLGLDKVALNDLLARSTSVSRATGWGLSAGSRGVGGAKSPIPAGPVANNVDQTRPATPDDKRNDDANSAVNGVDDRTVRAMSMRKPVNSTPSDQGVETPAVVRRTLIFPSEFKTSKLDVGPSSRRQSMKRHRRTGSATSAQSARSVHDRAPTPPPPKANGARRLSADRSPPIPSMATSITAQAEALLRGPTGGVTTEKPNSAYESLYDMYSGENKHASTPVDELGRERGHDGTATQEGTAVEVVEMANGETVWSIVNGLREDDVDSFYASRASSPDCSRENRDDMQIFVREHTRSASKGSSSSFVSLKKAYQSKNRPETKEWTADSFNFIPGHLSDRSSPSSFQSGADGHWTVEERLEQLLGAMRDP